MSLGLKQGEQVVLSSEDPAADAALAELADLVAADLDAR